MTARDALEPQPAQVGGSPLFVLRELSGVRRLEQRLRSAALKPNANWSAETEQLASLADSLSLQLFGLRQVDTHAPPNSTAADLSFEEAMRWEENFMLLDADDQSAARIVWSAMGWEVGDDHGRPLHVLALLGRQIICASKGLMGRLPGKPANDEELEHAAARWGADLEREARAFMGRRSSLRHDLRPRPR